MTKAFEVSADIHVGLALDPGDAGLARRERRGSAAVWSHRRGDWRAARHAAKVAVAGLLGPAAAKRMVLASRPSAAPRLVLDVDAVGRGGVRSAALAVSVSHCDGRAASAVSRAALRLGVDLERAGAVDRSQTRYFLTASEEVASAGRDPTELWALKEAAWKALRCAATLPFSALELHFDPAGEVVAVSLRRRTWPARAAVSTPWPGYVLAVFWSGAGAA